MFLLEILLEIKVKLERKNSWIAKITNKNSHYRYNKRRTNNYYNMNEPSCRRYNGTMISLQKQSSKNIETQVASNSQGVVKVQRNDSPPYRLPRALI